MRRKDRYALVAALLERLRESGSWCGETHLQKAIYQELSCGSVWLYKHGPYSFDLRDDLASMRADDALRLRAQTYPYGPTLEPTERGNALVIECSELFEKYSENLSFIAEWFGNKDVKQLERLATAYLVTGELGDGTTEHDRAEKLHELKPHVSMPLAIDAMREVDQLILEAQRGRAPVH